MLIKRKLPLMIIILVTVPLLLISFIIYYFTSASLIQSGKNNITLITKLEKTVLSELINKQITEADLSAQKASVVQFLENIMKNPSDGGSNSTEVNKMNRELRKRADTLKELEHSFIVDLKGHIIADSNLIIKVNSVSDRKYFRDALGGKLNIGDTIYSRIDGSPVIVFSAPVKDSKGRIIGVFCNSFYTEYFQKYFTSSIKLGKSGFAYIMDRNDDLVAYPDKSKIGSKIADVKIRGIIDKVKMSFEKNNDTEIYNYNNEINFMSFAVIPGLNWTLAVVQDIKEVNAPAMLELYIVIGIFVLMLIFSIISSILASRSITIPVGKIIDTMNKAAEGDLASVCDYKSDNELGQLSANLNYMINELSTSYNELSEVYEDLTSTEEVLRAQYDELAESQLALTLSEERYKQSLDGINDVIWELDLITNNLFASDKWFEIMGFQCEGLDVRNIFKNGVLPKFKKPVMNSIKEHIRNRTPYFLCEFKMLTGTGEIKWLQIKGKAIADSQGKLVRCSGSLTNITPRKVAEEKVHKLAYYDELTSFPNRNTFIKELGYEIEKCNKNNSIGAVLLIDLDDFKKINVSMGHETGNMLLKAISEKINSELDKEDLLCRSGGDEFLILKKNVEDNVKLKEITLKLLKIFDNCFELQEKQVFITASIGISIFPDDGSDPDVVLKNADTAMYKAKESGKNNYQLYLEEMSKALNREIQVEDVLRNTLTDGGFYLHYQPLVELSTGRIIGTEVLLRLKTDDMGNISPMEFIPVAEKTGLILPIGNWVIKAACEQNILWAQKGYSDLRISINVSSVQIKQPNFVETVINLVRDTGISPETVEIEITESLLMDSMEANVGILKKLREFGIRTALDDFGTGYSSLNYLRMIPINTLKIDKSFIDDICFDKKQEAIVNAIIVMAHRMDIEVIAEGVESQEQLELLKEKKCDIVQGYIFSRPGSSSDIETIFS